MNEIDEEELGEDDDDTVCGGLKVTLKEMLLTLLSMMNSSNVKKFIHSFFKVFSLVFLLFDYF